MLVRLSTTASVLVVGDDESLLSLHCTLPLSIASMDEDLSNCKLDSLISAESHGECLEISDETVDDCDDAELGSSKVS